MADATRPTHLTADDRFLERLVPLLHALSHRLHEHMEEATAAVGLSAPMAMALRALDPELPRPMSGLAGTLRCDPSNVTGIADRLEAQGLVARQPATHDRRVKELAVTPRGAAVRARFVRELERVSLRVDALDPSERATLVDLLGRLVEDGGGCAPCDGAAAEGGPDAEACGRDAVAAVPVAASAPAAPRRRRGT